MTNTALITGASAGIGREFAKIHARQGGDLILTARRGERLEALRSEILSAHSINVKAIALDLASAEGALELFTALKGQRVDILINNAGFGGWGNFVERDLAEDLSMIDLNITALVTLCHCIGQDMIRQGGGKILNVSSTASYMAGPLQATYFATKAFVSSFSQALDEEMREQGVTVTALEPGYVETEFAKRANLEGTPLTESGATAASVAAFGYKAMLRGDLRAINDPKLRLLLRWLFPLLPDRMKLAQVKKLQTR